MGTGKAGVQTQWNAEVVLIGLTMNIINNYTYIHIYILGYNSTAHVITNIFPSYNRHAQAQLPAISHVPFFKVWQSKLKSLTGHSRAEVLNKTL